MTKEQILAEIRRTAAANGGRPLGRKRFMAETGISSTELTGKYWVKWNDAVRESGLAPNSLNQPIAGERLLEKLATLVRELQHFPVTAELKMKRRLDPSFPDSKVFDRFGSKSSRVSALCEYARERGYEDVVSVCLGASPRRAVTEEAETRAESAGALIGYVYLLRHGTAKEFKIGRTNNPIRREGEIGIELPQQLNPIHVIATDDPSGVEAYWHRRFAQKRLRNEWFALTSDDVRAFRRWRRIH